ncbi:hypothetical protein BDW74DRAFT_182910 [Aspergillus multicolor]|uniref:uncharacterized protein n=1 Tax=Aspergillus multicolor TaxID=41759 RepID=UPI003CCDFE46
MHMNLRKTIRLPQRFSPDHLYAPMSSRNLRSDDIMRPPLIEYNPNLPPAAFPTLDAPRTLRRQDHNAEQESNDEDGPDGHNQRIMRESLDDFRRLTKPDSERETSPTAHVRRIPLDQLDNHIASNGDLNPVWVSNMARMAAAGRHAYGGMDMEDTDPESIVTSEARVSRFPDPAQLLPRHFMGMRPLTLPLQPSRSTLRDPTWSDLSYRMQVEIFLNLLERYSYPAVCRMLGLTTAERDAIETTIEDRRSQEELENKHLEAMRKKQFHDLARTDNSFKDQGQSYHLVFREGSCPTLRGLREYIKPETDFFACERAELTLAQTFLRKRAIEPVSAGTWGNDIAYTQTLNAETPFGIFGLDRSPDPNTVPFKPNEAQTSTSTATSNSQPVTPIASEKTYTNWLGDSPTCNFLRSTRPDRDPATARRWLARYNETVMSQEKHYSGNPGRQASEAPLLQDRRSLAPGSSPVRLSNPSDGPSRELALNRRLQHPHPHPQQPQPQRPRPNNQNNSPQRSNPGLQIAVQPVSYTKDKDAHSSRVPPSPRMDGDLQMQENHDPDETEDEFMHWDEMTIFPN